MFSFSKRVLFPKQPTHILIAQGISANPVFRMKRLYLLTLLLPLLHVAQAQKPFVLEFDHFQKAPEFSSMYLMVNGIKSIQVNTIRELKPGVNILESSLVQEFGPAGKLQREVELEAEADTSRIASFFYNDNGFLGWKQETDVRWGKVYRTGYRFLGADQVYQERDYEMLANEQVMLLETKQYVYNEQGKVLSISFKQGSKTIKKHDYTYNEQGQVESETSRTGTGDLIQSVSYEYYENASISKVVLKNDDGVTSTYTFVYDEAGLPTKIDWNKDEDVNGTIVYEYDNSGNLTAMQETSSDAVTVRRSFVYEKFQSSASERLAER